MKKLVSFFIFFITFFALLNNANSKVFLNSKELQGFEKIKNIKNKKEKPDKNGVVYVGQKGLILANGYGIMKFEDGGIFAGYFYKGNLRDGTWIIKGDISTDKYEYDEVRTPYCMKLLIQELSSMGIYPKIIVNQ